MVKRGIGRFMRVVYWVRMHKLVALLFLILLLIVGFVIYQKVATEMNRRAFVSARHTIDVVYADIVKELGQPDNSLNINECSHSHLELSEGPLACSVNTEFVYGVSDKSEADQLMSKIRASVAKHADIFRPVLPPKSEIPINPSVHNVSDSEVDYYSASGLFCGVKYVYNMPRETDVKLQNSSKSPFASVISCSSKARKTLYPLSN